MKLTYETKGVCAKAINFELEDGVVKDIEFVGGCNGNLKGIGVLCKGLKAEDVISKLEGMTCRDKATSCPDQLTIALKEALQNA